MNISKIENFDWVNKLISVNSGKIEKYINLIIKWSEAYNLTGLNNRKDINKYLIFESVIPEKEINRNNKLIDLGSGAGIPGIPLAIVRPDLNVILIEKNRKKVNFCREAKRGLNLINLDIIHGDAKNKKIILENSGADLVISRATWKFSEYILIAEKYIAPQGRIMSMKGSNYSPEVDDASTVLSKLDLGLEGVTTYHLDGKERAYIIIGRAV